MSTNSISSTYTVTQIRNLGPPQHRAYRLPPHITSRRVYFSRPPLRCTPGPPPLRLFQTLSQPSLESLHSHPGPPAISSHTEATGEKKNCCFENAPMPIAPLPPFHFAGGKGPLHNPTTGSPTSPGPSATLAAFQKAPLPPLEALEHAVPAAWEMPHLANGVPSAQRPSEGPGRLPCTLTRIHDTQPKSVSPGRQKPRLCHASWVHCYTPSLCHGSSP